MKKKVVGIIICVLLLSTIPVAAGLQSTETSTPDGLFSRTVVRGFILGSQTNGMRTSFFALRVHYTTYNLFGEDESGVLMFQRVTFTGKFTGHMGQYYISGTFRGSV